MGRGSLALVIIGGMLPALVVLFDDGGRFEAVNLVAAACLLGATVVLVRWYIRTKRALVEVTRGIRRIADGEADVVVAAPGHELVDRVALAVNRLIESLRTRRAAEDRERDLDRTMIRAAPNGLIVTDARGVVRRTNPALGVLLPIVGDPMGKRPIETIPVAEVHETLDEAGRTGLMIERNVNVGERELLVRAFPLDGGCMCQVHDLTSVRRAERARREFVANVSHELRTPVTALIGYAEALLDERGAVDPDVVPMIEAIERNARRLGALIEDVLSLSRIEARAADLRLESEPLLPVIEEVIERFALRARQKSIALGVTVPDPRLEALLNVEAFEHALGNLVDNAIKYTPDGGSVHIDVATEPTKVSVSVTDNGIGIDLVHHDRIFERFYRVDGARARDVGGTGLGLALVKHLCRATRSEVTLLSDRGKGSTFTLRLPRM